MMRWAQRKDWSDYPWQAVTALRFLYKECIIEELACGHDGKALMYEWQQAKRRRCIHCPPHPKETGR